MISKFIVVKEKKMKRLTAALSLIGMIVLVFMAQNCPSPPGNKFFGNLQNIVINGDQGSSVVNFKATFQDSQGNLLYSETFANPAAQTLITTDNSANFIVLVNPQARVENVNGVPDGNLIAAMLIPIAQVSQGALIPFVNNPNPQPGEAIFAVLLSPDDGGNSPYAVAYTGSVSINFYDAASISASYSGDLNNIVIGSNETASSSKSLDRLILDPSRFEHPELVENFLAGVKASN